MMAFEISTVDVWVASIDDLPGALAEKMETVVRVGANFEFVIARPVENQPCASVLFVAPVVGDEQIRVAEQVGLRRSGIHTLRIEGPDQPGLIAGVARTLADIGININGISACRMQSHAMIYVRCDSEDEVVRAAQELTRTLG